MKTILIILGILTTLVIWRPRRIIVPSLPATSEDRLFLANQMEKLILLSLNNQQDVDAWYDACTETERQIDARFGESASVLPHEMFHYFADADIRFKDPSYRASQDAVVLDFIQRLRTEELFSQ